MDPWKIVGWICNIIATAALGFCVNINIRLAKLELWRASSEVTEYTQSDHAQYVQMESVVHSDLYKELAAVRSEALKESRGIYEKFAFISTQLSSLQEQVRDIKTSGAQPGRISYSVPSQVQTKERVADEGRVL